MNKIIEDLAVLCKEAIESEARESYNNGDNRHSFNGCSCLVDVNAIEVEVDLFQNSHKVTICGHNCPNVENAIKAWLDEKADAVGAWLDEHDNDKDKYVDKGCDPAFPHHGDFERWAYGY